MAGKEIHAVVSFGLVFFEDRAPETLAECFTAPCVVSALADFWRRAGARNPDASFDLAESQAGLSRAEAILSKLIRQRLDCSPESWFRFHE